MLTNRQMIRAFESAVRSGDADRLFWAARAAFQFATAVDVDPWFLNQLAERLPLWKAARQRLNASDSELGAEGDRAIDALALLLGGGGPLGLIDPSQLPDTERAEGKAERQALADYLCDEDRLQDLRNEFVLPTDAEPVLVIGAIEFQGPPLVRMYHEGRIDRPWGEEPWKAEPALIEDAILMAFAVGDLHDPNQIRDVTQRLEPSLLEFGGHEARDVGTSAFEWLVTSGFIESTELDCYRVSWDGAGVVAVHLIPKWFEAQRVVESDFC